MNRVELHYPETKRLPVREEIGGITFEDPYEWLEEDTTETLFWQSEETDLAVSVLRSWAGFQTLRARLIDHAVSADVHAPVEVGGKWFQLVPPPGGAGRLVLQLSDAPGQPDRILIDPNALQADPPLTLDWFYPSPSARYVAYGLSQAGSEESVLHLLEVESGTVLPERIPFTMLCTVAWLPDESGFYYRGTPTSRLIQGDERIYFHRLGDQSPHKSEPIEYNGLWCYPQLSPDGRWVAAVMNDLEPRPDWIKEIPDGEWRPFLREMPGQYVGTFVGDTYVAITTDGHPRGRLVSIPIAAAQDRSTWRELVSEGEAVMKSVTLVGNHLVLAELIDIEVRLRVLSLDGTETDRVPLPGPGAVAQDASTYHHAWYPMVVGNAEDKSITFVFQSLTQSPAIYRYDLKRRELEQVSAPQRNLQHMTMERKFATAMDGSRIPYFVLRRKDLDVSHPNPVLIHAYGAGNYSLLPGYYADFAEFADAGGLFVLVNPRGGSEYGWDWWQNGRKEQKQTNFDDIYAVAEELAAQGLTTPQHTSFVGRSNGGLLAGVLLTQRPDLFGAVVPMVPLLDLMRVSRDPWTAAVVYMENGNIHDPAEAPMVYAYSPYHNVRDGVAYPAVLLVAGETDVRVPPWHARKMAARLQHASSSGRPVLLRVLGNTGHMSGLSFEEASAATAEWLGFIMQQLDLNPA